MMNYYNNNLYIKFLYLIIFLLLWKLVSGNNVDVYPLYLLSISLSILLINGLRSEYILGVDIHDEYYTYIEVLNNNYWDSKLPFLVNACLSVTVLPSIFNLIMNASSNLSFNYLYILISMFLPLNIYLILRKKYNPQYSLFGAIFIIMQSAFLLNYNRPRTNVSIFFISVFVLILSSHFNNKLVVILIPTIFAIITSHYGSSLIIFLVFIASYILIPNKNLKYVIIIFFISYYIWHHQITGWSFRAITGALHLLLKSVLNNKMDYATTDLRSISSSGIDRILNLMHFMMYIIFIGIMSIGTMVSYYNKVKNDLIQNISISSLIFLLATLLISSFNTRYPMIGIFNLLLVFNCNQLIIGYDHIYKKIYTNSTFGQKYFIMFFIFFIFFMFQNGVVYDMYNIPHSITLNSNGTTYEDQYIHFSDIAGINWVNKYSNEIYINADYWTYEYFKSQKHLINEIRSNSDNGEFAFYRYTNTQKNIFKFTVISDKIIFMQYTKTMNIYNSHFDHIYTK